MKRVFISTVLAFTLCIYPIYCQEKIRGFVGLSGGYDFYLMKNKLLFGISLSIHKMNMNLYGQYYLEGNVKYDDSGLYGNNVIKAYSMQNHFFGGGMRLRFRPLSRIYSPILSINLQTQIFSNYIGRNIYTYGGYLPPKELYFFFPTNKPAGYYSTNDPKYGKYELKSYYTYYYLGTPIMANLNFENEFRIIENLNIVVGVGYSVRKVRLGYKRWELTESEPESIISKDVNLTKGRMDWHHYLEFSVAFNYTFPFKKKPKTTTP